MRNMISIRNHQKNCLALCFASQSLRVFRRAEPIKPASNHKQRALDLFDDAFQRKVERVFMRLLSRIAVDALHVGVAR